MWEEIIFYNEEREIVFAVEDLMVVLSQNKNYKYNVELDAKNVLDYIPYYFLIEIYAQSKKYANSFNPQFVLIKYKESVFIMSLNDVDIIIHTISMLDQVGKIEQQILSQYEKLKDIRNGKEEDI